MDDLLEIEGPRALADDRPRVMPGVRVETLVGGRPKRPTPEDLADPGYDAWLCDKVVVALSLGRAAPGRPLTVTELRQEFGRGR